LNNCRTIWKNTGDAEEALRPLRGDRDSYIEGKLLSGLKNSNKDLVGALGLVRYSAFVDQTKTFTLFVCFLSEMNSSPDAPVYLAL